MSDFDFDEVFDLWLRTKRFTPDARALAQIRVYVEGMLEEEGGYLSIAHFERAYLMLRQEGEIPEFREPAPEPETPIDFTNMSVAEIRRRYASDALFARSTIDPMAAEALCQCPRLPKNTTRSAPVRRFVATALSQRSKPPSMISLREG